MVAITAILVVGIRETAAFNAAMVCLNLAVILLVIGLGATYVEPRNWTPFLHKDRGWKGIPLGAAHIFFAYIGFDAISTQAEEAKNPRRDLAIGILASLLICTVLYVAVAAILTGMVPYRRSTWTRRSPRRSDRHGTTWASGLITGAILAGITSALLVSTLSQPRILLAMARDGMLPPAFFAAVHPRFRTPWKSTILVGAFVGAIAALVPLELPGRAGERRDPVRLRDRLPGGRGPPPQEPRGRPARSGCPRCPVVAGLGILVNGGLMYSLGRTTGSA